MKKLLPILLICICVFAGCGQKGPLVPNLAPNSVSATATDYHQ